MLCRLALLFSCLAAGLFAQEEEESKGEAESTRRKAQMRAQAENDGKRDKGMDEEEMANLTPEQRLARNVTHGAAHYCRFVTALRPEKLMPGQSGTLMVTALLQGQAVMPSPAPMEMVGQPQQGLASLGSISVRPAEMARFAPAYVGRPVYDNFAIIEVPVTLSTEAEVGKKQSVAVDLRFDLYDANSAQPVGRFIDRAALEFEVGQAPDPVVLAGMPSSPNVGVAPAAVEPGPGEANPAPKPANGASSIEANSVLPQELPPVVAAEQPPTESPSLPATTTDGPPVMMMVGGGTLLLVLIALLARRK